jgi:hypothetical protein
MVAAHGTHAHIPNKHSNSIIYLTRYANCGEGVLEVTSMIYNTKYSSLHPEELAHESTVNHLVVPWGGVRRSTLRDMIMTEPNVKEGGGGDHGDDHGDDGEDDTWKVMKPMPAFSWASSTKQIRRTAGYTILTQGVKNPDMEDFQMPGGELEEDEDDDADAEEAEDEESNNEDEGDGDGDEDEDEDEDGDKDMNDVQQARRRKQRQLQRQRQRERRQHQHRGGPKRDDEEDCDDTCTAPSAAPSSSETNTQNNSTAPSSAPTRAMTQKKTKKKKKKKQHPMMRIVVTQDNPVTALERPNGTVYRMAIQPTVAVKEGHQSSKLLFRNPRNQETFIVDSVDRWSGAGGDTLLFRCSQNTLEEINGMLQQNDRLVVSHVNDGERQEDNTALSHVHGQNQCTHKPKFHPTNPNQANRAQAIARYVKLMF